VPVKIVEVEYLRSDAGRHAERSFRFFHQRPCSLCQTALSLSLGALAVFGIGLAIAQAGPADGGGSIRAVPLSEIQSQSPITVAQGVTLNFSDGGSNNLTVMTSDNPSVVQITSKTNVVTVAPGTAHLRVANFGQCPNPTEMPAATPAPPGAIARRPARILCDPIPTYSVTINVQHQP
jgi:hypothetical protein